MKRALDQLSNALSGNGVWTWWAAKFPTVLQLEFDHTMLYFGDRAPMAPSTKLAVVFYKPVSVTFIRSKVINKNWYLQLGANLLDGFSLHETWFNNEEMFRKVSKELSSTDILFGCEPSAKAFRDANIRFGCSTGDIGTFVAAESMRVFNLNGEIALNDISNYSNNWWSYWEEYNMLKGGVNALPYDAQCEAINANLKTELIA